MFGTNEIVGRKHFVGAPPSSLLVTSIFFTLQGEGPYAGRPAVFVRLAKCNLACSFCDTYFDAGDWIEYDRIIELAQQAVLDSGTSMDFASIGLVITGGEPLLQEGLVGFTAFARLAFAWIQIETNGTQTQTLGQLHERVCLVVSPKCTEVGGQPTRYLEPTNVALGRADALKFVMCAPPADGSYNPYQEVPPWAHMWHRAMRSPVYVSPMNIYNKQPATAKVVRMIGAEVGAQPDLKMRSTIDEVISFWEPGLLNMEANQRNHEHTARYALKHGFFLSLQMHLYVGMA